MTEKDKKQFNFNEITSSFQFEGSFEYAQPYGCGHINDTFAAYFKKSGGQTHRYILQRINHHVFKRPEELMSNIERITRHLKASIEKSGGDAKRETLNLILTREGKSFYKSPEGNYWRGYIFIEDARTYEQVENAEHFYNAGYAFGRFQNQLNDFPADELYETIPNFHNTVKRFEDFERAVKDDVKNRAQFAEKEINFILDRKKDTSIVTDLLARGDIPTRVTHNDTKFNNIMIDDKTGEGICVLDLDTVMPGSALYDFGDSIRFGASSALEDERDLDKVWMKLELFDVFAKGFLENTRDILTKKEIKLLAFSAKLMTLECGMRFLGDYLNGDIYFKIHREGHNLDRARTQIKLVDDMERKMDEMEKTVEKYIESDFKMMLDDKLLKISENGKGGYHPLARYDAWLVAILNQDYGNDSLEDVEYLEYHAETDEVFILLKGSASLIISGGKDKPEDIKLIDMQPLKCYNVKKGVWHSIILQNEGSVAIVENSDTSRENSAYYYLNESEKAKLIKLNESGKYND